MNKKGGCFTVFLILILGFSLLLNLVFLSILQSKKGAIAPVPLEEEFVSGDFSTKDSKIALIHLRGLISQDEAGSFTQNSVEDIKVQLKAAREDKKVKGIIVAINSPGGEVNASDVIYHEIRLTRNLKPVVIYMESMAASGGYYSAVGGSYLMANDLTITGSIGVIMESFLVKDLMDKVGIKAFVFKSGKMKDLLNPTREMTPEEQAFVQGLIDEAYNKFISIVSKERHIDINKLKSNLADGRIFMGEDALKNGLIDGLGYFEDAFNKCKELSKVQSARLIRYVPPFKISNLFRLFSKGMTPKIELGYPAVRFPLSSGQLYYLYPQAFGLSS